MDIDYATCITLENEIRHHEQKSRKDYQFYIIPSEYTEHLPAVPDISGRHNFHRDPEPFGTLYHSSP